MTPWEWHLGGAAAGGAFCGASGLLSYWLALKLTNRGPAGALAAMVSGLVLRTLLGLGGSAIGFTALGGWTAGPNDKIAFWLWVLAAYLLSLTVELVLLARRLSPAKAVPANAGAAATETGKG